MEYAIVYRPGPSWKQGVPADQQALNGHIAYVQQLRTQHKLVQDCPFLGDQKVTVVEVDSQAEAEAIASADPAVGNRVLDATITTWNIVFGLNADRLLPRKI